MDSSKESGYSMIPQIGQRWLHYEEAILEIQNIRHIESVKTKVINVLRINNYDYKVGSVIELCFNCCIDNKKYLKGQDKIQKI